MVIHILTLFPEMFSGPFDFSIVKRAVAKNLVQIHLYNLRDWSTDSYKSVDDRPYGGGAGMILKVDIIYDAIAEIKAKHVKPEAKVKVVLMDAGGVRYTQQKAVDLASVDELIIICGHYEGVDRRVHDHIADEIVSVGDYVLSGGELPAMTIVDSVVRLLPNVLGNQESLAEESHNSTSTVEYPQYTRPEEYRAWTVPPVLLSGNHKEISTWRATFSKPDSDQD